MGYEGGRSEGRRPTPVHAQASAIACVEHDRSTFF
jgi:hypothetical protein